MKDPHDDARKDRDGRIRRGEQVREETPNVGQTHRACAARDRAPDILRDSVEFTAPVVASETELSEQHTALGSHDARLGHGNECSHQVTLGHHGHCVLLARRGGWPAETVEDTHRPPMNRPIRSRKWWQPRR